MKLSTSWREGPSLVLRTIYKYVARERSVILTGWPSWSITRTTFSLLSQVSLLTPIGDPKETWVSCPGQGGERRWGEILSPQPGFCKGSRLPAYASRGDTTPPGGGGGTVGICMRSSLQYRWVREVQKKKICSHTVATNHLGLCQKSRRPYNGNQGCSNNNDDQAINLPKEQHHAAKKNNKTQQENEGTSK